jgi:hypothetical protein
VLTVADELIKEASRKARRRAEGCCVTIPNGSSLEQLNELCCGAATPSPPQQLPKLADIDRKTRSRRHRSNDWRITVYDKFWRSIGPIGDFIECSGMDPRNNLPIGHAEDQRR